jgi:Fe2+ or Zn2+ uptake regulation protein
MVIPYIKGIPQSDWHLHNNYYSHVGMYAYRNDILEAIAKHDKALSAYELQDLLKNEGKNYSAITIYRVIDTLLELDIVHKVHSINSFMKCCEHKNHLHRLLVCKSCHNVKPVERAATELHINGFAQVEVIDEVLGLCEKCH